MFKYIFESLVFYGFYKYIKDKYVLVWIKKRKEQERGRRRKREHFWIKILRHSKTPRFRVFSKTLQNIYQIL